MQRGILLISSSEFSYIRELISTEINIPTTLQQKFSYPSSNQSDLSVKIQISVEEAETMLDILPIPQKNELTQITSIRNKLQQFLTHYR